MKYRVTFTDDSMRVVGNACGSVPLERTRDSLIARQIAGAITHALIPDTPEPMRWADEPMPVVEVVEE